MGTEQGFGWRPVAGMVLVVGVALALVLGDLDEAVEAEPTGDPFPARGRLGFWEDQLIAECTDLVKEIERDQHIAERDMAKHHNGDRRSREYAEATEAKDSTFRQLLALSEFVAEYGVAIVNNRYPYSSCAFVSSRREVDDFLSGYREVVEFGARVRESYPYYYDGEVATPPDRVAGFIEKWSAVSQ